MLSHVPATSFEVISETIKDVMSKESGIYALYKKDKLYYVGRATDLHGRFNAHLRSKRHSGNWDNFSIFITKKPRFIADIEFAILQVTEPPGNKQIPRIPKHRKLQNQIKKTIAEKSRQMQKLKKAVR